MDAIGDFLTIIRNASRAHKPRCQAQWSKMREGLAKILKDEGFIRNYEVKADDRGFKSLQVELKYVDEKPVIIGLERKSKPGCRVYCGSDKLPRVLGGLGVAILTTSRGILTAKQAHQQSVGGEHVCNVW